MKLYTEEQIREAFIDGMKFIAVHPLKYEQDANEYINSLTPIELPSDEEIYKEAKNNENKFRGWGEYETSAFLIGSQYIKNKLQGGNK